MQITRQSRVGLVNAHVVGFNSRQPSDEIDIRKIKVGITDTLSKPVLFIRNLQRRSQKFSRHRLNRVCPLWESNLHPLMA